MKQGIGKRGESQQDVLRAKMTPRVRWIVQELIDRMREGYTGNVTLALEDAPTDEPAEMQQVPPMLAWAAENAMRLDAENREGAVLRVSFIHGGNPRVWAGYRKRGPGVHATYDETLVEPKDPRDMHDA